MGCAARSRSSARDGRYRPARPMPNRMERGCNAGRDRPWLAIGCPQEGGESIVSRASITKSHQKIQELAWEPTFVSPVEKFATDYTFEKAQKKDPLKQILRSYFPMEEEKDNRVFGAMDGAIRGNMFRQVQQRWMEWQKLFLSIIPFPEISAARAMPLVINAVPNPEFHNTLKAFQNNYAGTIGRQFGEGFITGDAVTAANVYLTIVAETAFTNVLFVG